MVQGKITGKFPIWLSEQINSNGLTNRTIARDLNISETAVSCHAHGALYPSFNTVKLYCAYFGFHNYFDIYQKVLDDKATYFARTETY